VEKGKWRNLLVGGKKELEESGTKKETGEICYGVENGNWRNLLVGGKRELGNLLVGGKRELEKSVTGWKRDLEKSVTGWKKRTGEICFRLEKGNCRNLESRYGVEKGNWGNLLGGERR
jgi:hypothetical protein